MISEEDLHKLLFEAGKLLKRLHGIPTAGFGRLNSEGRGHADSWRQAYWKEMSFEKAYEASKNVGMSVASVERTIQLLQEYSTVGENVRPCLLHGDFSPQNILVEDGKISGILDFEFCSSGDPAREVPCRPEEFPDWWDSFLGRQLLPKEWMLNGYFQEGQLDKSFERRQMWFSLWGCFQGFCYHGVNDCKDSKMMAFLRERFQRDLETVCRYFKDNPAE